MMRQFTGSAGGVLLNVVKRGDVVATSGTGRNRDSRDSHVDHVTMEYS